MKKTVIEEERKVLRERLKIYLECQKELAGSLKEQLVIFADGSDENKLKTVIEDIKKSQKEEGEQAFALLRDFQFRLKTLRQDVEELIHRLQRVLERGELIKLDDLRQLRASLAQEQRRVDRQFRASIAYEQRKAEKKLRSEDVQRLLAHFNQERQESVYQWRGRSA
jgi:hypothetical protein